jgi:hypothetical protein
MTDLLSKLQHWLLIKTLILAVIICKWGIPVNTNNYQKLSSSDLNIALASASVSNMTNLAIAIIGIIIISVLTLLGVTFRL